MPYLKDMAISANQQMPSFKYVMAPVLQSSEAYEQNSDLRNNMKMNHFCHAR